MLVVVALTLTGAVNYAVDRHDLGNRLDDILIRWTDEFHVLSETGVDLLSGAPYAHSRELMYTMMQRSQPSRFQGMLAMDGPYIQWTAPDYVDLRLEDDSQFVQWAGEQHKSDQIKLETVSTDTTMYRVVTIPVQLREDEHPDVMVIGFDYKAEVARLNWSFWPFLATGFGILLLSATIAWPLVGRMLAPFRALRDAAQSITDENITQRVPVHGHDEFTDLSRSINTMVDGLEQSLRAQRRLLDDVGHELRTPVTILSGHLQLMDVNDPKDVESTREVCLDEIHRMGGLIDDLVTLATSNRQEFISPVPTHVDLLLAEIYDKARAMGERQWTLENYSTDVVDLDPERITQALLQLCANSLKFSHPGSEIVLRAQRHHLHGRSLLRLSVSDQGVGIEPADSAKIFERFGRGSNSARLQGSGLGLNIVSAIAQGHGGSVAFSSVPGRGSTFHIDIPLINAERLHS